VDTLLNWELDLIIQMRNTIPNLVGFFELLTALGGEMFFLVLLPLIYWCLDRRTGARLTVLFLISACTNNVAKLLFHSPRPFVIAPQRIAPLFDVSLAEAIEAYEAHGNGFPSGHTQSTIVIWGYLAAQTRRLKGQLALLRPLIYAVAALLVVVVPLSRVYLAVHFPRDLLGGYLLGMIMLALFAWLAPGSETGLARLSLTWQLVVAITIPLAAALVVPGKNAVTAAATLLGMGVGFAMERRWIRAETDGAIWQRALRFVLGMAILGGLYAGLKVTFEGLEPVLVFRFIRYTLVGLWGSLGAPWAFTRLRLSKSKA
jgi:membrane-associated phospholipid phosphatase